MKPLLFILLSTILLSSKCRKEQPPDPNSTYFICKVDGKDYRPNNCANCITCTILGDTVLIFGANRGFETLGVGIRDLSGFKPIQYILNDELKHRGDYKNSTTVDDRFFTDATRTGVFTITAIDKNNKIITGTFYFQAYNPVQNKIVNVTDGKFRLKYTTY